MIKIETMEQNDKLVEILEDARGVPVTVSMTARGTLAVTEHRTGEDAVGNMLGTIYVYKDGEVR